MAKRKARFNSLSTPGTKQDCSNYLVELAFLRDNHGLRLPAKFWQTHRYKFRYRREIQACRKFIKKYGEPAVLLIAMENHITTWTDYAKVEFLLQRIKERKERLAELKDTSPVKPEVAEDVDDLRTDRKPAPKPLGLFERLEEFSNEKRSI